MTVSQNGVVRIMQEGSAEVSVWMARNQFNRDTTKIYISPPTKLEIIEYNMETAVGETLFLHIGLYGRITNSSGTKEIPFNDCHDVNFEVYITDGNFVHKPNETSQPVSNACATIALMGLEVGISGVTVAYNADGKYLMDNITISAYEPLTVVHPQSAQTLLAVGSMRRIIFKGGPTPRSSKLNSYLKEAKLSNNTGVELKKLNSLAGTDVSVYQVLCRSLGEATLIYSVSNEPILPNCKKAEAVAEVKVICGKPRYIQLKPEFKDSKKCPISQNTERVMAHTNEELRVIVVVKDKEGRTFDNITSLNVDWSLKPSDTGSFGISSGTVEETFVDMHVTLPKSHYQHVYPKKSAGSLTVVARVIGYQKTVLNKFKIIAERPAFPVLNERDSWETPLIEATLNVILVNDTVITPDRLQVLNDPNAKYSLQVTQGSGYYEFVLSSEEIADIRFVEPTKTITVVPKKSGELRVALVDLCLVSAPAEAIIQVQQLAAIEVNTVSKVEKGKCVEAAVKFYDTNGDTIRLPSLEAVSLITETDNENIKVKLLPSAEQGTAPYDQVLYVIHGVEEGETRLTFSSGDKDEKILSKLVVVQVFTPLRMNPKNLTILANSVYQVTTLGGPSNAEIEFTTGDDQVVTVDRIGVMEGKAIGKTTVIARAIGFNSKGNKIIYSQDEADIYVVCLEGIKIISPTTRIKVGTTIPLWAFGIPQDLTPLVIGSVKTTTFTWTSSDSNLLQLENMYEGTGINISYQNQASVRLKALKSGVATVYLKVVSSQNADSKSSTFSTFVKVQVFDELQLIKPEVTYGIQELLMAPNSFLQLKSNLDKQGSTIYKVVSSSQSTDTDDPHALTQASKIVTVDKNGLVRSGETNGKTMIHITNVEEFSVKQSLTVIINVSFVLRV